MIKVVNILIVQEEKLVLVAIAVQYVFIPKLRFYRIKDTQTTQITILNPFSLLKNIT